MKKLFVLILVAVAACAQTVPPEIPADLTISHLNSVIEYQALEIKRLEARVNELERTAQLASEIAGNIAKMKAVCAAKDSTLAANPQNGLYQPDKQGKPYCIPNPKGKDGK